MKPRFTLKTLLVTIALVGIACGSVLVFGNRTDGIPVLFGLSSALWMPLIFAAYAIGRRSVSLQQMIAFAIAQAVAIGISSYCVSQL